MACLRKESPSISSRSKLKPSLALDSVKACRMRPGLGPRLLGESPAWSLCWGTATRSREGAVGALGPVDARLQTEVALFVWSEVLPGVHSSLGCGGLELGFFKLWEGCTGTEVVVCIDSRLCSPGELGWERWQLSSRWRCSSWWPSLSQLATRAVPLVRFLVQVASPCSRAARGLCSSREEWWLLGCVREVGSGVTVSWCLQLPPPSSLQDSGQEMKVLLSIDLFQPKSRFGYLPHTNRPSIMAAWFWIKWESQFSCLEFTWYRRKRNKNMMVPDTGRAHQLYTTEHIHQDLYA